MHSLGHPAVLTVLVAGITGTLALLVTGGVFAEEAGVTATPFQAIAPILPPPATPVTPPVRARVPYESELIEADPARKHNRRLSDQVDRLEEFSRLDPTRTERPAEASRLERPESAVGLVRPERVERPATVERPEKLERPLKVERPERLERLLERLERVEKVERRERIERPERRERHERHERVDRSGRH